MHCPNCGAQVNDGAQFCDYCGTQVGQFSAAVSTKQMQEAESVSSAVTPPMQYAQPVETKTKKRKLSKIFIGIIIVVIVFFMLGDSDSDDECIQVVKDGHLESYPDITFGQAFDRFFEDCEWEYFESEENEDIVEFSGGCLYQDAEVTVTMQFVVDDERKEFEMVDFDMNGVPQDQDIINSALITVFDDYRNNSDNGSLDAMAD